jgi:2-phosphosulfolactate phosphatase
MPYFDQEQFDVRCEWAMHAVQHLAPSDIVIVVDILSFTTCVDVALGRGAIVFPYSWKDDTAAAAYAREHSAELAGHRGQADTKYSLAPSSLVNASPGLRLVLPSPNGSSIAFAAMTSGATVLAGCLRNAAAVAAWAQQSGRGRRRITVVPAGERWPDGSLRPAMEDLVGAGAILRRLGGRMSPEARVAVAAFDAVSGSLREQLLQCASGRELSERGFAADVELATELDVSQIVPVLSREAFTASTATAPTSSDGENKSKNS